LLELAKDAKFHLDVIKKAAIFAAPKIKPHFLGLYSFLMGYFSQGKQ